MFEKLKVLFKEYADELQFKVTWPTFAELQESTITVLVASFIIAIIIFILDLAFSNGLSGLYGLFK